jgi:hypothetical protein
MLCQGGTTFLSYRSMIRVTASFIGCVLAGAVASGCTEEGTTPACPQGAPLYDIKDPDAAELNRAERQAAVDADAGPCATPIPSASGGAAGSGGAAASGGLPAGGAGGGAGSAGDAGAASAGDGGATF